MSDRKDQESWDIRLKLEADLSKWPEPVFANLVSTVRSNHEVTIFFSRAELPIIRPEDAGKVIDVEATPVARVVLPASAAPEIVQGLKALINAAGSSGPESNG